MIKKIAIIGSGVMGSGIAQSFAVSGYFVTINDIKEELLYYAQNRISENLSLLMEEGALTDREKQGALANITYSVDLKGAVRDADFIIEAIPEVIELKLNLYQQLEEIIKPDAIVASNTSTFPISQLMEKASFAERMVITHFFNPGHLVPLVEIVQHDETKPEIVKTTMDLMRKIGKSPILLKKEIAGFIANRLQTALMREAFYLLKEGVADAEDIDTAITAGPGFRWAFTGPIEIADFGGLDTWQRVFDNVSPVLDQSKEAPELIRDLVAEGKLGTKSGEGIFTYEESTVSQKINERDRNFIKLGKLKMEKEEVL
ncbi:3-hydroxyacyl-CoA dehydrogenase family protein [Peribacillus castrilensis]|uniref:L-gulonate 3-dehydrogenase n=1 Tax=Peribacillus simplex TaxID=1478 RepID=A0AAN2PKJ6_9BACI|nr:MULTISPECIES: 3-hydroxyacyl-CoA dehydrogenase family protein [Peribacillus]MBD8589717.1 3-hydroxyacyl-CoA dehydrogenase family protein [Peribacillus simplex]MCP1154749.1 3-hydroxyacyl-CoA dehydrogenase family protein [Peribacillus frigoritolerans]MCT1388371.1 3-hydroxyacyl-CoA dehydrogenase family protein [Peribacillus frigoritolerans]MEA3576829.1 3-hydroxyacyl-CoA dehydrogenase family protein [Peribacillus frigoritolerans]NCT36875.1 3-hydroxyacyl-CoA dehydrogenase family protein [Peribacil